MNNVRMIRFAAACAAMAGLAAPASAQQVRVAIVSAAGTTAASAQPLNDDVQSKLMGTGLFSAVDILDVAVHAAYTPTLAELQQYDAVITWSNGTYADAAALGDVLADYVDAGGGVVVAVFANSTTTANRRLEGRWRVGGDYEIVRSGGGNFSGQAFLGSVLIPSHPIMDGVNSFDGGTSSFRPATLTLSPHGEVVAEWNDGRTLVGVSRQYANRADLGMYPPSSDTGLTSRWNAATDGAIMMANALVYTTDASVPCYPDCDGNSVLDFFDFLCFQNAFLAGDPYADCDGNGVLDFFDFLCFQNAFLAGCP